MRRRQQDSVAAVGLTRALKEVQRGRRRLLIRSIGKASAWLSIVFGSSVAMLVVARAEGWLADGAVNPWWLYGVAAIGVGAAFAYVWWRMPSLGDATRAIDDVCELKSSLVTASEAIRHPVTSDAASAVRGALLRDLDRKAHVVRAERLPSRRLTAVPIASMSAIAVAVLLMIAVSNWSATAGSAAAAGVGSGGRSLTNAQRASWTAELEGLARALEEEASHDGSVYTKAIAARANELVESLGGSKASMSADELSTAASELAKHAAQALGAPYGGAADGGLEVADTVQATESDFLPEEGGPQDLPARQLPRLASTDASDQAMDDVRAIRERLEYAQAQRSMPSYLGDYEQEGAATPGATEAAGKLGESPDDVVGTPAGAAQRSTDAAGDAAGAGSRELDSGQANSVEGLEEGEAFQLPKSTPRSGPRVNASGDPDSVNAKGANFVRRDALEQADAMDQANVHEGETQLRDHLRHDSGGWRREALDPQARLLAQRLFEPNITDARE